MGRMKSSFLADRNLGHTPSPTSSPSLTDSESLTASRAQGLPNVSSTPSFTILDDRKIVKPSSQDWDGSACKCRCTCKRNEWQQMNALTDVAFRKTPKKTIIGRGVNLLDGKPTTLAAEQCIRTNGQEKEDGNEEVGKERNYLEEFMLGESEIGARWKRRASISEFVPTKWPSALLEAHLRKQVNWHD
ncbi:unnamed protein product [Protopolystoma xenopodis]|uniref:Uncharacterized protein n=1 Tax=Protopolystoma xenopodis TaxID=117903 RepID=A0A448XS39_9PLAT|nr:unnamed protein product [Protopolystoma xenopodis]